MPCACNRSAVVPKMWAKFARTHWRRARWAPPSGASEWLFDGFESINHCLMPLAGSSRQPDNPHRRSGTAEQGLPLRCSLRAPTGEPVSCPVPPSSGRCARYATGPAAIHPSGSVAVRPACGVARPGHPSGIRTGDTPTCVRWSRAHDVRRADDRPALHLLWTRCSHRPRELGRGGDLRGTRLAPDRGHVALPSSLRPVGHLPGMRPVARGPPAADRHPEEAPGAATGGAGTYRP